MDYALAGRVVDPIPLAGRSGGKEDVGPVAILDRETHERALIVLQEFTVVAEHGDHRDR